MATNVTFESSNSGLPSWSHTRTCYGQFWLVLETPVIIPKIMIDLFHYSTIGIVIGPGLLEKPSELPIPEMTKAVFRTQMASTSKSLTVGS